MQSPIGSVFLGDVQRLRLLSTSTPPSSPPPHISPPIKPQMSVHDVDFEVVDKPREESKKPSAISPALSLDLRIRWLETLLYGARQEGTERKHVEAKSGESLARRAEELQRKLVDILGTNDGLRRFMEHCKCNRALFVVTRLNVHLRRPTCSVSHTVVCSFGDNTYQPSGIRKYVSRRA